MAQVIISRKTYLFVFIGLIALLVLTIGAAFIPLGTFNPIVAITIAICKALLITLFFMHIRYSSRITWVIVGSGLVWLMIMIGLTMTDFLTRGWLPIPGK